MVVAIEQFLDLMLQHNASDLHLSAEHRPRLRIDGELVDCDQHDILTSKSVHEMILEMIPESASRDLELYHDADFAYTHSQGFARFRVNAFKDLYGFSLVARAVKSNVPSLDELGMPDALRAFCRLNKGLFIVTGPTGSGKSTTLAAMLDYMNECRSDHIITIEDPIEYVHLSKQCLINQREVPIQAHSFSRALRSVLRADPDIILVGEMRDLETIEMAIQAAETGHLVLGTLHTSTAYSATDRIVNVFPQGRQAQIRTMLAGTLKGVLAQALCKKSDKGRVAATELLVVTDAVANVIRESKLHQLPSLMQAGAGMHLMEDSLAKLVLSGAISIKEALYHANDARVLRIQLEAKGIEVSAVGQMTSANLRVSDKPDWLEDDKVEEK